jgi:hypothetical protein
MARETYEFDPAQGSEYEVALDRAGTREAQHPTRPEIRLLDPDFYTDPEPLFAWMRREAPVYQQRPARSQPQARHRLVGLHERGASRRTSRTCGRRSASCSMRWGGAASATSCATWRRHFRCS